MKPEPSTGLYPQEETWINTIPVEALPAVKTTVQIACQVLGNQLCAMYGMGSLGYGGYAPGWSDVDIDLVLNDCEASAALLLEQGFQIRDMIHQAGYPSVDIKSYTLAILNDPSVAYEYGITNRAVMILDSAKLLYGQDIRPQVCRPDQSILRNEAVTVAKRLLANPDAWWKSRPLDDIAALLALPGRLLITGENGQVVGKTLALERLLQEYAETMPASTWPWVVWALACRSMPLVRETPASAVPLAQAAARTLLEWSLSSLQNLSRTCNECDNAILCST